MEFLELFRAARRASTPLVAVRTPDPAQTQRGITDAYPQDSVLSWDARLPTHAGDADQG